VLYLAIDDSLRGKGYGSRILSQIKAEKPGQRIVLNIEPLDDKAPQRRAEKETARLLREGRFQRERIRLARLLRIL
jgi:hypothetical protein